MRRQAESTDRRTDGRTGGHAGKGLLGFGPSYNCSFCGGSSRSQRGAGNAKALGEVAAFFRYLLASLPVAWMGTIIAF